MDIFEFAIEKEKLSEDYYRQLAQKTDNEGLQKIFIMLAGEEEKHAQVVRDMQKQPVATVTETSVLDDARKVFESMRQSTKNFNVNIEESELYQKACRIEIESEKFYREKAGETRNPQHKDIFLKLADEENKHYRLLESIGTFVERPKWFLENAEMYRFDDYAGGEL
jgi:rubrerythrin